MLDRKQRLGKGLEALIPKTLFASGRTIVNVPIDEIRPNPYQPRKTFDDGALKTLANSIKVYGVAQPILVRKVDFHYELVAGERRYRASLMAGQKTIPSVIRELTDQESVELALIENLEREDLNAMEIAKGFDQLVKDFSFTHQTLSKMFGKSRSSVTNTLRLLNLPLACQESIVSGEITEGHARTILSLKDKDEMVHCFEMLVKKKSNVREWEKTVTEIKMATKGRSKKFEYSAEQKRSAKEISDALGVGVKISGTKKRGSVVLTFRSEQGLSSILEVLKKGNVSRETLEGFHEINIG